VVSQSRSCKKKELTTFAVPTPDVATPAGIHTPYLS
jgi:hypothetical protein